MYNPKFRQKNKNNGQYHYWGFIESLWVMPLNQDNYMAPQYSDQYTGLNDVEGKEIFGGDSLVYEHEGVIDSGTVEMVGGMWMVVGKIYQWNYKTYEGNFTSTSSHREGDWEIGDKVAIGGALYKDKVKTWKLRL